MISVSVYNLILFRLIKCWVLWFFEILNNMYYICMNNELWIDKNIKLKMK